MLCGQHILLPIVLGRFEDPPIARRPNGQDRRDPPETSTRKSSAPQVSIRSQTGIVSEDNIVEHTSETAGAGNGEDDDDLIPPSVWGTTAGRGDDD